MGTKGGAEATTEGMGAVTVSSGPAGVAGIGRRGGPQGVLEHDIGGVVQHDDLSLQN